MTRVVHRILLCLLVMLAWFGKPLFAELSVTFISMVPFVPTGTLVSDVVISKIANSSLLESEDVESILNPDVVAVLDEINPAAAVEFRLMGKLLNYPNPFSYSTGQTEIGFRLSKAGYLTFKVYTLTGQQVYERALTPNDYGKAQYNRLPFSKAVVGDWLAPGVYVYVLIYEGRVLAKNRMVLLP